MLQQIRKLLEMIRFSHTIFALPFALLAAVMAWQAPAESSEVAFSWLHLLGILIAMVGARSAAMAFNRLVDRKLMQAMNGPGTVTYQPVSCRCRRLLRSQ